MAGYRDIVAHFEDEITSGRLVAGDRLPSERQLMEDFSVARATVRTALDRLRSAGLVSAQQGKGYFVGEPASDAAHLRVVLRQAAEDLEQAAQRIRDALDALGDL